MMNYSHANTKKWKVHNFVMLTEQKMCHFREKKTFLKKKTCYKKNVKKKYGL